MENYTGLIILALLFLLLMSVNTRNRRQQRQLAEVQASVRPGLWVMTTSGVHGQIVTADEGEPTVVIEIAPGVNTRWARLAIAEVFDEDPVTRAARAHDATDTPAEPDDRTLT